MLACCGVLSCGAPAVQAGGFLWGYAATVKWSCALSVFAFFAALPGVTSDTVGARFACPFRSLTSHS